MEDLWGFILFSPSAFMSRPKVRERTDQFAGASVKHQLDLATGQISRESTMIRGGTRFRVRNSLDFGPIFEILEGPYSGKFFVGKDALLGSGPS